MEGKGVGLPWVALVLFALKFLFSLILLSISLNLVVLVLILIILVILRGKKEGKYGVECVKVGEKTRH